MATGNTLTSENHKNIDSIVLNKGDESLKVALFSFEMYDALVECCQNNIKTFGCDAHTPTDKRFVDAFHGIIQQVETIRKNVEEINAFAHEYDFDEMTPANGYRSIVKATNQYIDCTMKVTKYIIEHRENWLFRRQKYLNEIETLKQALVSLCSALKEAIKIRTKCAPGSLIPSGDHDAAELFDMSDAIDQKPFYGHYIGLHYCESIRQVMKLLAISVAGYSEFYYAKKANCLFKTVSSIYNGSKYFWNGEHRSKRILELTLYSDIQFFQKFLSSSEVDILHGPSNLLYSAQIQVNRLVTISPERLEVENAYDPNKMVRIPVPSSHLGIGSVTVRLLSNVRREGMQFKRNKRRIHPMSNCLVFHCHGGGFVAHTSKSHEIYLRGWAAELQVPIVSVDYSLAPKAPYPRALEEVFYAYCWAMKNANSLGTTAGRIIAVGDSSGGALIMALMLKCIDQSVRRPDGALLIYAPLILGFQPIPSRLLTGMDLLLPFGLSMKYLKAYIDLGSDKIIEPANQEKKKLNSTDSAKSKDGLHFATDQNPANDYQFNVPLDPFISPLLANDEMLIQLPSIKFVCGDMDPLIDDNVTMAKRLKLLQVPMALNVLPGLPHAFLNFAHLSKDASEGNRLCISHLAELLLHSD